MMSSIHQNGILNFIIKEKTNADIKDILLSMSNREYARS